MKLSERVKLAELRAQIGRRKEELELFETLCLQEAVQRYFMDTPLEVLKTTTIDDKCQAIVRLACGIAQAKGVKVPEGWDRWSWTEADEELFRKT